MKPPSVVTVYQLMVAEVPIKVKEVLGRRSLETTVRLRLGTSDPTSWKLYPLSTAEGRAIVAARAEKSTKE